MVRQIVIEAETPGDSRTMFRLLIDASLIAEELTAVQAHILLGEILEQVALPKASERAPSVTVSDASTPSSASFPSPGRVRVRAIIDALFWPAAVHATMTFARRLAHVENIPQRDSAQTAFNKLARTFAAQVEALKQYRNGGEQKMTVQHVHVAEGGQAIVGNVSAPAPGVGANEKKDIQPHALGYAPSTEMPRQIEAKLGPAGILRRLGIGRVYRVLGKRETA
jgi:hypothetical protein